MTLETLRHAIFGCVDFEMHWDAKENDLYIEICKRCRKAYLRKV